MGVAAFLPGPAPRSEPVPEPEPEPEPEVVTADELVVAVGLTAPEAARLAPVVSAMVDKYAPSAPLALRKEAAIRAAGWLADSPASTLRSTAIGPVSYDFAATQRGPLLHSGAKSLLYSYRTKTAGVAR